MFAGLLDSPQRPSHLWVIVCIWAPQGLPDHGYRGWRQFGSTARTKVSVLITWHTVGETPLSFLDVWCWTHRAKALLSVIVVCGGGTVTGYLTVLLISLLL